MAPLFDETQFELKTTIDYNTWLPIIREVVEDTGWGYSPHDCEMWRKGLDDVTFYTMMDKCKSKFKLMRFRY